MKKIFAANWKLNKSPKEATEFLAAFHQQIQSDSGFYNNREVLIFPSAFSLEAVSKACASSQSQVQFGPQNVFSEKTGAFTGENSASVAQELGSRFVLIGHSERRQIFNEVDSLLNMKVKLVQNLNLTPVFCIGETLQQRESDQTESVCFTQLEKGLMETNRAERVIVAYEPVWAIGTGKVATVQQVADIHAKLNEKMKSLGFNNFQLLYGGSVKPDNAKELLQVPFVDGFLIGGAALDPKSFHSICSCI